MKHALMLAAALLALHPVCVTAAVYKCTDANGKVSYRQQPCQNSTSSQQLNTGGSQWISLRTGVNQQGAPKGLLLDTGSIKTIGAVRRATFKDVFTVTMSPTEGRADSITYYYYYNCTARTVSGAVSTEEFRAHFEEQLASGTALLFPYKKLAAVYFQPHADPDIVARVCGAR